MVNYTHGKQRGAIIPIVGVALIVLLGFAGLVIDLGGLFVAKTELQSALDSCALSAAQELDGAADAITRAGHAGLTAGNVNNVQYQKSAAGIVAGDISFSDSLAGSYSTSFTPVANAKYAKCTHSTPGIAAHFIELLGGPATSSVGAVAIATRTHAQSTCPIPVGLRPKAGGAAPNYGFQVGEWVNILYDPTKSAGGGEAGWYNLDGTTSASETRNELANGYCNSSVGNKVKTPGAKVTADDLWNSRFGIYKNNATFTTIGMAPDYTGYAYTSTNWTNTVPQNAYSGTKAAGSDPTAANFKAQRLAFANYDYTGTSISAGDKITGLNVKGGYKSIATSGASGQLEQYGENRRVVLLPVVSSASIIVDYACMLMLQPFTSPTVTIQLEYLGSAGAISSPCSVSGLAGGTAGPLIPVLVE